MINIKQMYYLIVSFILSIPITSQAFEHENIYLECSENCTDIRKIIKDFLNSDGMESFAKKNTIFILTSHGVDVNSITYSDYIDSSTTSETKLSIPLIVASSRLQNKEKSNYTPFDGALSCEYDNDYDCEAWEDWDGRAKPYLMALKYLVDNYQWAAPPLSRSHIDNLNTARKLTHDFVVISLTTVPAGRMVKILANLGKNTTAAQMIAGGIVGTGLNRVFNADTRSKLKVGDVLIIKGGNVHKIIRDSTVYDASQIFTTRTSGGSDIEAPPEYRGNRITIRVPVLESCWRDFSNGQRIEVPCP